MLSGKKIARQVQRVQFYMPFFARTRFEMSDVVNTSIILVYDLMDTFLFDPSSSYSFVFVKFSLGFDALCNLLDVFIQISNLV